MIKFYLGQLSESQLEVIHGITSVTAAKLRAEFIRNPIKKDSELSALYQKVGIPKNAVKAISSLITVDPRSIEPVDFRIAFNKLNREQLISLDGIHLKNVDEVVSSFEARPPAIDSDIHNTLEQLGIDKRERIGLLKMIAPANQGIKKSQLSTYEQDKNHFIYLTGRAYEQIGHQITSVRQENSKDVLSRVVKTIHAAERTLSIVGGRLEMNLNEENDLIKHFETMSKGISEEGNLLEAAHAAVQLADLFDSENKNLTSDHIDLISYNDSTNEIAASLRHLATIIVKGTLGNMDHPPLLSARFSPTITETYAPMTHHLMYQLIEASLLRLGVSMIVFGGIVKSMSSILFDLLNCKDRCSAKDSPENCFLSDIIISSPIYGDIEMTPETEAGMKITTELIDLVLKLAKLKSPTGKFSDQVGPILEQIKKYQEAKKNKIRALMEATSFNLEVVVQGQCCETKSCLPWFVASQKKLVTKTKRCTVVAPENAKAGPPERGKFKGEHIDLVDPEVVRAIVEAAVKCCKEMCS